MCDIPLSLAISASMGSAPFVDTSDALEANVAC